MGLFRVALLKDNLIYFGDQRGFVYALDSAAGQLLWKEQPALMWPRSLPEPAALAGPLYVPAASHEENSTSAETKTSSILN
jgi:outer membrane protein assembly factor BamB